jgi:hypothetical protein
VRENNKKIVGEAKVEEGKLMKLYIFPLLLPPRGNFFSLNMQMD